MTDSGGAQRVGQRETWQRIEEEARAQIQAELDVDEVTPLEFGKPIVWSSCVMGRTNGISDVHRVGFPQVGHAFTACGELIPAPIRWVRASAAVIRTMGKCHYCEAELIRIARRNAA